MVFFSLKKLFFVFLFFNFFDFIFYIFYIFFCRFFYWNFIYFLIFTFVSTGISSLRVRKLLEVGLFKSNCHAFDLQLYLSVLCSSSFILVSLHSVIRCTLVYSRGAGYSSSFFCLKFAVTFLFLYLLSQISFDPIAFVAVCKSLQSCGYIANLHTHSSST